MTFKPEDNDPADLDALAGEYVLGTLDAQQRRSVEQRLACAELMLERLHERFSDEAVRDTFWRLAQVTDLTAES